MDLMDLIFQVVCKNVCLFITPPPNKKKTLPKGSFFFSKDIFLEDRGICLPIHLMMVDFCVGKLVGRYVENTWMRKGQCIHTSSLI